MAESGEPTAPAPLAGVPAVRRSAGQHHELRQQRVPRAGQM